MIIRMKKAIYILIGVMVLSLSAFAGSARMNLLSNGQINGQQLNAGEYKLSWTGEGNVQVAISGHGVNMTVPGTLVQQEKKQANDSVLKSSDGSIQEVRFEGKKFVLKFSSSNQGANGK